MATDIESAGAASRSLPAADVIAYRAGFLFFFLSGAAALIYELVWLRYLGLVFGNTTYAIATVLAAYMAGLGLGSYFLGALADKWSRPLRVYGLLEIGIGVYGILTPMIVAGLTSVYVSFAQGATSNSTLLLIVRLSLCFLLLFIPTFFMGATLPILARFYIRRSAAIGTTTARLYGLNTMGAVIGTMLAGFWLMPACGVQATLAIAVFANIGIGVMAWLLSAGTRPLDSTPVDENDAELPLPAGGTTGLRSPATNAFIRRLPIAMLLSGATAMIYEVGWSRTLAAVLDSSTYAFTLMLATFLLGIGLGSAIYKRCLANRAPTVSEWGWLQVVIVVFVLAGLPLFSKIDLMSARFYALTVGSVPLLNVMRFVLCSSIMLVPALCFGALFPVSVALYTRDYHKIGRGVGTLYLFSTGGNILGSLAAGFILIPTVGIFHSLQAGVIVGTGVAIWALVAGRWQRSAAGFRRLVPATAAAVVMIFGLCLTRGGWDTHEIVGGYHVRPQTTVGKAIIDLKATTYDRDVIFYREGLNSIVSVGQTGNNTFLKVNGKTDASTGIDMRTQILAGHLPMLLHPAPKRSLVIGFGSGTTFGATLAYPENKGDCAEIEPAVIEAARHFERINRLAYKDTTQARIILNDGRNHLLTEPGKYDVIVSEPSNPWMAGVSYLFTVENYEMVRRRLNADGIFCQWLHSYTISPADFKMILASVQHVFPHVTLWKSQGGDNLIIAAAKPIVMDFDRIAAEFESNEILREDMGQFEITGPGGLLSFFQLGEKDVWNYVRGSVLNTDDKLLLEYNAPKALYEQITSTVITKSLNKHRTEKMPAVRSSRANWLAQPDILTQLGFVYLGTADKNDRQLAGTYFKKAIAADKNYVPAHIGMGRYLYDSNKAGQALKHFEAVVRAVPNHADANAYAGVANWKLGKRKRAIAFINKGIELEPEKVRYHQWRGQMLEKSKLYAAAAGSYRKARELADFRIDFYIAEARCRRQADETDAAAEILEALRQTHRSNTSIYTELRKIYEETGQFTDAVAAFEDFVKANPYRYQSWIALVQLYEASGEDRRAEWARRRGRQTHSFFDELLLVAQIEQEKKNKDDVEKS